MDTQVFPPKIGVPTPEGGRPPCEFEHRKSLQEIEAPARGTPKIVARTGETIPVGTILTGIG